MDEMKPIVLSSEDSRLGRDTAEGRRWPEFDLNGQPYNRNRATVRHLTPALFVVIPHRWVGEVKLGYTTPAIEPVAAPEEEKDAVNFRKSRGSNAGS